MQIETQEPDLQTSLKVLQLQLCLLLPLVLKN